jgi:biopolymer transport protein TolQ
MPPNLPMFPLGLIQSFLDSTWSGQAIVIALLISSIIAWSAMWTKFHEFRRAQRENRQVYRVFREGSHPLAIFMKRQKYLQAPVYRVYLRSCQSAVRMLGLDNTNPDELFDARPEHLHGRLNAGQLQVIREAAERELADQVLHLENDMVMLATITNIAPFLGLLGTVWGVMDAFNGMAITGSPTLDAVAPGIAGALVTTVIGLLIAIPTVIGFNILSVRLRNETVGMDNFVQELMAEFHHAYVEGT